MDKTIPFPQADDFSKVIKLLNIENPSRIKDKRKVSIMFDGIAERQVQYYLSACMYLGIIDVNKEFTELGLYLRKLGRTEQEIHLARLIISHDIFGYVYFAEKRFGSKLIRDDVIEYLKSYVVFESEEMYKRRSQTIIKWIEWVNNTFNDSF